MVIFMSVLNCGMYPFLQVFMILEHIAKVKWRLFVGFAGKQNSCS